MILTTAAIGVSGLVFAALATQYFFQNGFWQAWSMALAPKAERAATKYPSLNWAIAPLRASFADDPRQTFGRTGRTREQDILPLPNVTSVSISFVPLRTIPIYTVEQLSRAMQEALPGDYLQLQPGTYQLNGALYAARPGTAENPVTLGAARLGDVTININAVEGFQIAAPYWIFEKLLVRGICPGDESCEHAFHVVGDGRHVVIRQNDVRNFNAHVKANFDIQSDLSPNDGIIEGNRFSNDAPRRTTTPVTPLDLDVVSRWQVVGNVISDFAKADGNHVSYAAFMKATGKHGLFAHNLVACEWLHTGGDRVGLSYGGGGSRPDFLCKKHDCTYHHEDSVMRENIIMHCPNDVGIFINDSRNILVENNILYRTVGIDVRFPGASATLRGNRLDGRIRSRDGGKIRTENNKTSGIRAPFLGKTVVDPLQDQPR